MIDRHDIQDALSIELQKVLTRYSEEFDLSYADLVGVLECLKAESLSDFIEWEFCQDWDDEEDDEGDEGEEWKR